VRRTRIARAHPDSTSRIEDGPPIWPACRSQLNRFSEQEAIVPESDKTSAQLNARRLITVAIGASIAGLLLSLSFGYSNHSPTPHDLPVDVVGPATVVRHIQAGLDHAAPGGFDVVPATSVSAARNRILGQDAGGALLVPPSGPTTILTAGAGGLTVQQVVRSALWASSRALGRPAIVRDIAPLPPSDRSGLASFDFELGLLLPSVLACVLLYFVGRTQRIWNRIAAAAVFVVLVSAAGVLAQYAIVGSLSAAPAAAYGVGVLGAASFVLFIVACQTVLGLAGTALAAVTLIFVGNALTGGTTPRWLLPDAYRQLSNWMPTSAIVRSLRSVVYFGGDGLGHPLLVMFVWSGVALLLIVVVDLMHVTALRHSSDPPPQVYARSAVAHIRAQRQRLRSGRTTGEVAAAS
jgi:hypothetical protein